MANEIFTRIQLKYDSYANWKDKNPTLLAGELAIAKLVDDVTVPVNEQKNAPVLFKVGPGAFNDLPWASATAADVYSWAKKTEAEFKAWVKDLVPVEVIDNGTGKFVTDVTVINDANGHHITITRADVEWNDIQNKPDLALKSDIPTNHKVKQTPVTDPTANGKALEFIDTIAQNENGEITATKKSVNLDDYAKKTDLPTELGVMSVDKVDGTAITVDNTDPANPEVGLLIDPNAGNVVLSQSNSGLKAEIDLGDYALKSELHTPTTVAQGAGIAVTESGDRNYIVAHADTSSVANVTKTDRTYVSGITFDDFGHVTAIETGVETDQHIAEYSIVKDATSEYAATYHLTKDGVNVGAAINIPKDMVVEKGEVKELEAGTWGNAGTYIVLTLSNATNDKLYINVGDLIEYVTSGSTADSQVIINIDDQHKVTATIGAGKITAIELAADAVITAKIADKNVTEAKLEQNVQDALALARTALQEHQDISGKKDKQTAVTDKGLTGAKVLGSLTQNENGEIDYTVRDLTLADIGAQAAGDYKTKQGAKEYTGSTTQTITSVKQNENGEITGVVYQEIGKVMAAGIADSVTSYDDDGNSLSISQGALEAGSNVRINNSGIKATGKIVALTEMPLDDNNYGTYIRTEISQDGILVHNPWIYDEAGNPVGERASLTSNKLTVNEAAIGGVEIKSNETATGAIKYLVFNCGSATVLVD